MEQTPSFFDVVEQRHSVRSFDSEHTISREELMKILEYTAKAPSSWNLQHWKFLVIDEQAAKEKLYPIANNQKQVLDAAATIAVLGDVEAYKHAEPIFTEQVERGYMTEKAKEILTANINAAYENIPNIGPHEAIRNASLAAMQFMLTAKAFGYDTVPMGGFNAETLVKEFNIPSRYLPVLLISVGKAAKPAHASMRLPIEHVTVWNRFE